MPPSLVYQGSRLLAVAIEVARHRTFDTIPRRTRSAFGIIPCQRGRALRGVVIALEIAFDLVEALAGVLLVGGVAGSIGRRIVAVDARGDVVRLALVLLAPVR